MIHHAAGGPGADGGAETVGHQHEETLRRGTDVLVGILVDEERAGDVEEVERHAVHDAAQNEHPHAAARVAGPEEAEAEHPREHRDEHHLLDAELLHRERDQQDAEGLGELAQGDQRIGVIGAPGIREEGILLEGSDEGVGVAVRDLQGSAEQHREDEEHGELALLEELERVQAGGLCEGLRALGLGLARAVRQGQRIGAEHQRENAGNEELVEGVLVLHAVGTLHEVHEEHREDETDGAEHADGREGLDRVLSGLLQGIVGHGVGDGDGRHIESDAQRIERIERTELDVRAGLHGIPAGAQHGETGDALAEGEHLLRRNPFVGDDAHEGGHEDGNEALGGEEKPDLRAEAALGQKTSHRGEVGTPRGELQDIHQDKPQADVGFVHNRSVH